MFERYECESSTLRTVPSHVEGAVQWAVNSETRNFSEAMHCGCRLPRRGISADVPITVTVSTVGPAWWYGRRHLVRLALILHLVLRLCNLCFL